MTLRVRAASHSGCYLNRYHERIEKRSGKADEALVGDSVDKPNLMLECTPGNTGECTIQ